MTRLYLLSCNFRLPPAVFEKLLLSLGRPQEQKVRSFRRWQDAQATLFGRLLLLKGLQEFGVNVTDKDIRLSAHGKPYLNEGAVSFNISHSGSCVACIVSNETDRIGIDVEAIKVIDVREFEHIWTKQEWAVIRNSSLRIFYKYWTSKEAIIKADGRGLSIPLRELEVQEGRGHYAGSNYYLHEIHCPPGYVMHIASPVPVKELAVMPVHFSELSA